MEKNSRQSDIKELFEKIKDIKFAMLTTIEKDGTLRSRPMGTMKPEENVLWFFTNEFSAKVDEINKAHQVNLSYAEPKDNLYVSVSGEAFVVKDKNKIKELWNPVYKAWFPEGVDDPKIALLRVEISQAEYWDAPNGLVVRVVGFARALVTGQEYRPGENKKINF